MMAAAADEPKVDVALDKSVDMFRAINDNDCWLGFSATVSADANRFRSFTWSVSLRRYISPRVVLIKSRRWTEISPTCKSPPDKGELIGWYWF
jgi:hypothetical protein